MRIPVYLVVAQWALLFALGLLVAVMYRQLGQHLSRTKSTRDVGPAVGSRAIGFEYTRMADEKVAHFAPGDGRAALVAFVDPTCPACEALVAALGEAYAKGELAEARALLLVSDPPSYLKISEPFRTTPLEIGRVLAGATQEAYRAFATPLLVAIDRAGVVRAAGTATHLADVRAFAHSCLLPVSDHTPLPVIPAGRENRHNPEVTSTIPAEREARLP